MMEVIFHRQASVVNACQVLSRSVRPWAGISSFMFPILISGPSPSAAVRINVTSSESKAVGVTVTALDRVSDAALTPNRTDAEGSAKLMILNPGIILAGSCSRQGSGPKPGGDRADDPEAKGMVAR
jgi:hypothetical protein